MDKPERHRSRTTTRGRGCRGLLVGQTLVVVGMLALLFAACGSSGSDSPTTSVAAVESTTTAPSTTEATTTTLPATTKTVTYEVTSGAVTGDVLLTYTSEQGESLESVVPPWSKTVVLPVAERPSIIALGPVYLKCSVTVDGKVVSSNEGFGSCLA